MNLLHEDYLGGDLGDGDVGGDYDDNDYKDGMIFLQLNLHAKRWAREAYNLGIRYIGGCCGFEPYHIRWIFWDNGNGNGNGNCKNNGDGNQGNR